MRTQNDWADIQYSPYHLLPVEDGTADIEGTTAFFRRLDAFIRLMTYLKSKDLPQYPKILVAPCSIGCEAYTLALIAAKRGVFEYHPNLKIYALDIVPDRLKWAERGIYSARFMVTVPQEYRSYFLRRNFAKHAQTPMDDYWHRRLVHEAKLPNAFAEVPDHIKSRVVILPAQDLLAHKPENNRYDAATCFSLIEHMTDYETGILAHLLSISDLVCFDSIAEMNAQKVSAAFRIAAKDDFFCALDSNMEKTRPMAWNGPQTAIGDMLASALQANTAMICRL